MIKEGEDFYFDKNGLMVFTEKYHLKRGYCCGSGCINCPFMYVNMKEGPRKDALIDKKNQKKIS